MNYRYFLRVMKLLLLFMLAGLLHVSAASNAQTITLHGKNLPLKHALDAIRIQAGYEVAADKSLLRFVKPITIYANQMPVEDFIEVILRDQPIEAKIEDRTVYLFERKIATVIKNDKNISRTTLQERIVSGKVTDEEGNPLDGVTVRVKGTSAQTSTNVSGNYEIQVPQDGSMLVFTAMGFEPLESPVAGHSTISVSLKTSIGNLDEVVVVGYGIQKKVNLTGAVSMVSVDDQMSSRAISNVSSALSGLMPGLTAIQTSGMAGNNRANLLIRGLGTVNNANPLIVVDGMPDVDINRIDINDVATISVLKDAASSAVYGSRAANGVILITTKSGKGKHPTINYTTTNALETPVKAHQFISNYPRALTLAQLAYGVDKVYDAQYYKNGSIDEWLALGMVDPVRYPNTDWWDVFMQNGSMQKHNLSASGGNDLSNFYISVGTQNQQGLQINNEFKLYNARINYDYKVRKNLNVGVKLNGNTSNFVYAFSEGFSGSGGGTGNDLQNAIAGILPFDPATGYYGGVMTYGEDPQAYNPLVYYENALKRQNRQEGNGSVYIDWTPLKGLTGRVDYAVKYYNQFLREADTPQRAYNFQTGAYNGRDYLPANSPIVNNTNTGYKTLLTGSINYTTTIAEQHELTALVVYSEEYWNDRALNASRRDRLHPSLSEIDAALTTTQTTGGNSSEEGLRAYIGRFNYAAFDKYLLEATFRYDGSSKFLPGSQYGFFPSVSAGWRFSEEDFMKSLTSRFLSNGKLRVSYGSLGNNSGVGRYEQQVTLAGNNYITDPNGVNAAKGFIYRRIVNTDLTWENTAVFNAGLDLGFLDHRLTAELDYYNRLTTGMNRPSELSILIQLAYDAPRRNIGNLRNRGLEATLGWRDNIGHVKYGVALNASYNATTLEKWNEYLGKGTTFINMPYHFVYAYEDMGIAQTWQDVYNAAPQGASPGDVLRKDLNGDGKIDDNDRRAYPNIQQDLPTTNFSLNSNFSWKGFDLAVLLQGSAGRKDFWLNNFNNMDPPDRRYAFTWEHWQNPWTPENRDGAWPRLKGNQNRQNTTFWLDDMSFLRIKNLQLGYIVPARLIQKVGINSLRIFASAENLATLTSFRGLDPEKSGNSNDLYPTLRSYSLGVNLNL